MPLTKFTVGVNNIQALSDLPNTADGLTSAELKQKFDKAGADIKYYINEILTEELDDIISGQLNKFYPVGSIYLSVNSTNPSSIFGGTWEKIATGRTLWGASNDTELGTTVDSGLPNIQGFVDPRWSDASGGGIIMSEQNNGALYTSRPNTWWGYSKVTDRGTAGTSTGYKTRINLDASRSSSVYGGSDIVQPPAYKVNIWRRIS